MDMVVVWTEAGWPMPSVEFGQPLGACHLVGRLIRQRGLLTEPINGTESSGD